MWRLLGVHCSWAIAPDAAEAGACRVPALARVSAERLRAYGQAKLEHYLPTATDSVLCDYVIVMVGNKKTSSQVALDLEVSSVLSHRWRCLSVVAMFRLDFLAVCTILTWWSHGCVCTGPS